MHAMAAQPDILARIAPGDMATVPWDANVDGFAPLTVLAARGRNDGPTLLITAGVHGDEYEGPVAIARFMRALDVGRLTGNVIAILVLNTAAWANHTRTTPMDVENLNRLFPGSASPAASPTTRFARAVFDAFTRRADVTIDLHAGGIALDHLPLAGWVTGDARGEALARRFGAAFTPWIMPAVPGVYTNESHHAGNTAIGAEWRGRGMLDPAGVDAMLAGLRNVAAELGMIDAATSAPVDTGRAIDGDYVLAPCDGLLIARVCVGQTVAADAMLGELVDLAGNRLCEIRSPQPGTIAALANRPNLHEGDIVAYVG